MSDAAITAGLSATNTPMQNKDALSRAISAGGEVTIEAGVYPCNPLTISTPGAHLRFAPGAVLQIAPGSKYHPSLINIAADNVTIDGGEFDGSGIEGAYGVMAIRIKGSSSHICICNCTVRNVAAGIGSYVAANAHDWTIEGNTIDTTISGYGIFLHGDPRDNRGVSGVRVVGNTVRNTKGNGIWIGNKFNDVVVSGNQVRGAGRMGIEVWTNPEGRFVIAENIIGDCGSFGVSIAGTPHTICSCNQIAGVVGYGIEVANSRFITLANNHINGVRAGETGGKPTGIMLIATKKDSTSDISIAGGVITGCHAAINPSGGAAPRSNIAITGVVISDCVYGVRNVGNIGQRDGGGPVEDLAISGCSIHVSDVGIGNSVYGGLMRGGVITGNNIHVVKGQGIDLFRPAEMLVAGNRIRGEDAEKSIGVRVWDHAGGTSRAHDMAVRDNHIVRFEMEYFYSGVTVEEG